MRILACLILFSCIAAAQEPTAKGNYSLGGKIAYTNINTAGRSVSLFEFSPQVSLLVHDGVEYGISFTAQAYSTSGHSSESMLGIGPFANIYLTENRVKPFIGAAYTYTNSGYGSHRSDLHLFSGVGGVHIPLNNFVALQPLVQFTYYKDEWSRSVTQTMFGISVKAFI